VFKGPHFVADLTIDPEGIVYIVDALSPVIYKVDQSGRGSILIESDLLRSETGQVKAIAYHKHEYLLVAVDRDILKVDLKTGAVYMVSVETEFDSINSLHFTKEYLLVVSEGGRNGKVHILNTSNSWLAGKVLRTDTWQYKNPMNIEFVDNRIYILDSQADKVASSDFSVRIIDLNKLPTSKRRKARILAGDVTILKKDF
jgi:WD40 repeat protein